MPKRSGLRLLLIAAVTGTSNHRVFRKEAEQDPPNTGCSSGYERFQEKRVTTCGGPASSVGVVPVLFRWHWPGDILQGSYGLLVTRHQGSRRWIWGGTPAPCTNPAKPLLLSRAPGPQGSCALGKHLAGFPAHCQEVALRSEKQVAVVVYDVRELFNLMCVVWFQSLGVGTWPQENHNSNSSNNNCNNRIVIIGLVVVVVVVVGVVVVLVILLERKLCFSDLRL